MTKRWALIPCLLAGLSLQAHAQEPAPAQGESHAQAEAHPAAESNDLNLGNWRVYAGGEFQEWSAPGGPAYLDQLQPGVGGGVTAGVAHDRIRILRDDGGFFNLRITHADLRLAQGTQTNLRARYGVSANFDLAAGHIFGDPSLDAHGRTLNFYLLGDAAGLMEVNVNELKPDQRELRAGAEAGVLGQAGDVLVTAGLAARALAGEANDGVFGFGVETGAVLRLYVGDFSVTGEQRVGVHTGQGGTDLALDHTQAIRVAWHPDDKFELEASLARTATSRVPNQPGAIDYLYHAPDDSSAVTAGLTFGFEFDESHAFSAR